MTLGSRKLRGIEATSIWSEMPGKAAGVVFPVFLVLAIVVSRTILMCVCACVCVCVCVFIKLHITTQSGPVILVILCHSH